MATTYDTEDELITMYAPTILRTIKDLDKNKVERRHGCDATKIADWLEKERKFDRIVWQFPHAGFPEENEVRGPGFEWGDDYTTKHTMLLEAFFIGAKEFLNSHGQIVITHKTIEPFSLWDIPGLAQKTGYRLFATHKFSIDQYPGYFNRRGAGK